MFTCRFILLGDTGYLLEVDIDYPKNLHKSHRD